MSTDSVNDWSTTVGLNTNIAGTDIDIGCAPQDVGVFMRTAMAQIAYAVQGSGGAIPDTWHVGTLYATTLDGVPVVTADGATGKELVNISQFSVVNSGSGSYQRLPGGITRQWGNSAGPTAVIVFPVDFSGAPQSIQVTLKDAPPGGSAVFVQVTTDYTAHEFTVVTITAPSAGVSANFFWEAVGPT